MTTTNPDQAVKRILLFSMTPFYGGGEVYYFKLAKLLVERYQLSAVVANPRLHEQFVSLGVPSRLVPSALGFFGLRYFATALALASAIRNDRPDVVHLNGQAETYLSVVPWLFGVPSVCTRHTPFDARINRIKRIAVTVCSRLVRSVICVSEMIKQQLAEAIEEHRLVVIPNWIEPLPEPQLYCSPQHNNVLRLLYVGRIVREKGVFDLLDAIRHTPNVSLDIVGDGPEIEYAKSYSLNLPVTFHGFHADCSSFYRRAHLLVFPSRWEGQGFAPVEAMSYGLPSLISDIPTGIETSNHGRAAKLFRTGDIEDLAANINELHASPDVLSRLSENGFSTIRERFTKERVRGMYFELLDRMAQRETGTVSK
jgi:glycosyltransferase involved in cell wall biosynthesis